MILLTDGATRLVLLIGSWAVKLPRFDLGWRAGLHGLLANMQERTFSCLPGTAPAIFAAPGGWLNIARRCAPLTIADWQRCQALAWDGVPVEMKRSSFGVLGGRIVAVDYGS